MTATENWSYRVAPSMEPEQFQLWQALLEERTGIALRPDRKTFLENSLFGRMRQLALDDYETYYEMLVVGSTEGRAMEWAQLVDRLTVQETSFFRHPGSFALVQQFAEAFVTEQPAGRSLQVWSVGCATGEEAYSLAMLIDQQFQRQARQGYYGVIGTDISLPALARARAGRYGLRRLERVAPALRERYFQVLDEREGQVCAALRERVCFAQLNVLALHEAPMRDLDIIFCQNLLIYFRRWRKRQIVNRLAERLAPGGLLVLGPGEMTDWDHPDLERMPYAGVLAFRRRP